ncbi:hypothetical protein [Lysobacter sp. Root916]|uniref:hypothetical protein n=1 Tax=Lysobacter sp. Root916 TaxID=1736606 RepID=UPI0012F75316|nr:hypothetical protein [Lysobacter sp. Root916]
MIVIPAFAGMTARTNGVGANDSKYGRRQVRTLPHLVLDRSRFSLVIPAKAGIQ